LAILRWMVIGDGTGRFRQDKVAREAEILDLAKKIKLWLLRVKSRGVTARKPDRGRSPGSQLPGRRCHRHATTALATATTAPTTATAAPAPATATPAPGAAASAPVTSAAAGVPVMPGLDCGLVGLDRVLLTSKKWRLQSGCNHSTAYVDQWKA